MKSQHADPLMNRGFVVRLLVNAAALWVAARVVPGVSYSGGWIPFFCVALIFGVVNTFVGFTAKVLTFPLIVVTLGLFIFIINGFTFWLVAQWVDGFQVTGFWAAVGGALLYSVISWALSSLLLKDADG
jgi:putative membrane protein